MTTVNYMNGIAFSTLTAIDGISIVSPFSPPDPTNLVLWLEANVQAYSDAGTTLATNGQTVQQWNDQSGNSHNVSQATSGSRPTFVTNAINGLPALDFDQGGTSDFMAVANTADLNMNLDSSVFVVLKVNSLPGGQNGLAQKGNAYFYYITSSGKQEIDRPFTSNGAQATTDLGLTVYHVVACIISGTGVTYYVNSTADGTTTVSTGSTNVNDFTIGAFGSNGTLSGRIAEMMVYKTAVNSTDRGTINTYLGAKYGLF